MLTPFHSAASLIKAAACRRGCPVSSEMVNKAEMFCPHPEALKGRGGGGGMKTIIQSRKTRGFTYRQQCGEAAVNFLPVLF